MAASSTSFMIHRVVEYSLPLREKIYIYTLVVECGERPSHLHSCGRGNGETWGQSEACCGQVRGDITLGEELI